MAEYVETLFPEVTDHKKRAFLAAYAHTGRITHAAKSSNLGWRNHYNWIKTDPVYAQAFAVAGQMAGDWMEDEAIRRAKEGVFKPVFYKGEHVDDVQEFSDTLLIFLLKGAKPEKYKDRFEHTGAQGGPMAMTFLERVEQVRNDLLKQRNGHEHAIDHHADTTG
jgi:hypothetical protein